MPQSHSRLLTRTGQTGAPIGAGASRPGGREARADGAPSSCPVAATSPGGEHPRPGNYVGAVYRTETLRNGEDGAGGQTLAEHQAQASGLVSRPGAMLLDYLRAVVPDRPAVWEELRRWLGPTVLRPFGWRGWYDRSAVVLDGGIIAWCSGGECAEREGVLIDLPGRACASLGDRLVPFLQWCLEHGKVRRCDYAIDDMAGLLTRERIEAALEAGHFVMMWSDRTIMERWRHGVRSWTRYLGSTGSDAFVRIYDKRAERIQHGELAEGLPAHLVRLEFVTAGDFADALARRYFQEGSAAVVGQVARRLRFVEPPAGEDSNVRRWPVAGWWQQLLGSVVPGPSLMCGEKPECTLLSLAEYVERQAGPAMATLVIAAGGDIGILGAIASRSEHRLKPKHLAALAIADSSGEVSGVESGSGRVYEVPWALQPASGATLAAPDPHRRAGPSRPQSGA